MDLKAELATCVGGETIALPGGDYGDVSLAKLAFAKPVTITSADPDSPATFPTITLNECEGLTFDGIAVRFVPDAETLHFHNAVRINSSEAITIRNSSLIGGPAVNGIPITAVPGGPEDEADETGNVLGLPAARAIMVQGSSGITISGSDISLFHKGIVLSKVADMEISGNEIHDLRTTPLSGSGLSNIDVNGNHFHTSTPWAFGGKGDHGDMVHFWTLPGYDAAAVPAIAITGNRFDQGDGYPIMGIYLDDNGNGIGFSGVRIVANEITGDNGQAIRLEKVSGVLSENVARPKTDGSPAVILRDGCDLDLIGNSFPRVAADETSVVRDGATDPGIPVGPEHEAPAPEPGANEPAADPVREYLVTCEAKARDGMNRSRQVHYAALNALEKYDARGGALAGNAP